MTAGAGWKASPTEQDAVPSGSGFSTYPMSVQFTGTGVSVTTCETGFNITDTPADAAFSGSAIENTVAGPPGTMTPENTCAGWIAVAVSLTMRTIRSCGGSKSLRTHTRNAPVPAGTTAAAPLKASAGEQVAVTVGIGFHRESLQRPVARRAELRDGLGSGGDLALGDVGMGLILSQKNRPGAGVGPPGTMGPPKICVGCVGVPVTF